MRRRHQRIVCQIIWNNYDSSPAGDMRVKMKGCFTFMHECNQTECVTSAEPRKENIHFCCCMGSRCNSDHKYIRTTTEATTQGWFRSDRWGNGCFSRVYPNFVAVPFAKRIYLLFILSLIFIASSNCNSLPAFQREAAFFVLTNSRRKVAPRTLTISHP